MPSAAANPARGPCAAPWLTTNAMFGPGDSNSARQAAKNRVSVEAEIMAWQLQ